MATVRWLVFQRISSGANNFLDQFLITHRLQSVQNAAARLTFRPRRSNHITDALVTPLVTSAGKDRLQGRRADLSSAAR